MLLFHMLLMIIEVRQYMYWNVNLLKLDYLLFDTPCIAYFDVQ